MDDRHVPTERPSAASKCANVFQSDVAMVAKRSHWSRHGLLEMARHVLQIPSRLREGLGMGMLVDVRACWFVFLYHRQRGYKKNIARANLLHARYVCNVHVLGAF